MGTVELVNCVNTEHVGSWLNFLRFVYVNTALYYITPVYSCRYDTCCYVLPQGDTPVT